MSTINLARRVAPNVVAYASENGTIGIYSKLERLWRVKSKSVATCQALFPAGNALITGWRNGRWEIRRVKSGEILFKSQMDTAIAAILVGDFQREANSVLIVDVKGAIELFKNPNEAYVEQSRTQKDNQTIRKLGTKKDVLALELDVLKKTQKNLTIAQCVAQNVNTSNLISSKPPHYQNISLHKEISHISVL